jgi:hypothetical protein
MKVFLAGGTGRSESFSCRTSSRVDTKWSPSPAPTRRRGRRGGSNAKAKRELGWQLAYPTWRRGFVEDWVDVP